MKDLSPEQIARYVVRNPEKILPRAIGFLASNGQN